MILAIRGRTVGRDPVRGILETRPRFLEQNAVSRDLRTFGEPKVPSGQDYH